MSKPQYENKAEATKTRELKRETVKEELVALTGDAIDALLLNHFIKCQARHRHIEKYIEEEQQRLLAIGQVLNIAPTQGWFYKKAAEVSQETMLNLADSNMRARIKKMVARGWLKERENPHIKWDKTKQYRVEIALLDQQLRTIGYHLDGWLIGKVIPSAGGISAPESATEARVSETKIGESEMQDRVSDLEIRGSNIEGAYQDIYTSTSSTGNSNTSNQQHGAPLAPNADVAGESSNSFSKASKRGKKIKTPFDGLTVEQTETAQMLVDNGVWANIAAQLVAAPGVTRQVVEKQLEWLPTRIAEIEARGDEVPNPAGLLKSAISNLAPQPTSLDRAERAGAKAQAKSAEEQRQAEARQAANSKLDADFAALPFEAQQALDTEIASVDSNRVHLPPANEREQRALVSFRREYLARGWTYTVPESATESFDDDFDEENYEEGPRYLWVDASFEQLNVGFARLSEKEQKEIDAATEADMAKVVAAGHAAVKLGTKTWESFRHKVMRKMIEAGTLRIVVPVDKERAA